MKDKLQPRSANPFIQFNPPDIKNSDPSLGGKPAAQQTVDPETPKTGDPSPYTAKKKKKIVVKEAKETLKDHIRRRQIRLYRVDEILKPSDGASKYIHDFVHSDNPKFKGKTKKERINMALGAYYSSLKEGHTLKDFNETLGEFLSFATAYIGINELPTITLQDTPEFSPKSETFGCYSPSDRAISLSVTNRHPMDVFRSLAHELVHHKQNEDDVLHAESGQTGSDHENEANSLAGIILRDFAKANPHYFELESVSEAKTYTTKLKSSSISRKYRNSYGPRSSSSKPSSGAGMLKRLARGISKRLTKPSKPSAPTSSPTDSFEKKVQTGVERERVKAEVEKRLSAGKIDKSNAKTTWNAYVTSIKSAAATSNPEKRREYIDAAKTHANTLRDKNVPIDPKGDLNTLRHKPKPTPAPGRKPPPVFAEDVVVKVKTHRGKTYRKVFPSKEHALAWRQKQLERENGRTIEVRESIALMRKSQLADIPYPIILEIYSRGLDAWNPTTRLTREQYAFNRVNSFLSGGKSRTELDKDLVVFLGEEE